MEVSGGNTTFDSIVHFDTALITIQTANRWGCNKGSLRHEDSHVRFSANNNFGILTTTLID